MPRPKSLVLALLFIACFTLSTSCAEKNECNRVSKELRKYTGPAISFEYSKDMYVDLDGYNFCSINYSGSGAVISFGCYSSLADGKTLEQMLASEVRSTLKSFERVGSTLVGNIENVQRRIQGKLLKGKLLRSRSNHHNFSGKKEADSIEEIFVYQKGVQVVSLEFITTPKDRALAECYFKIIADSIKWESQCLGSGTELRKYAGPPISFEYSSEMTINSGQKNKLILDLADPSAVVMFSAFTEPAGGKTSEEALDAAVKSIRKKYKELGSTLIGAIKDAQRSIKGQIIRGKLLRVSALAADSNKERVARYMIEVYAYKNEGRFIILEFKTTLKDRLLAECHFKIIADSIKWESQCLGSGTELRKYAGPPLSFEYSSGMEFSWKHKNSCMLISTDSDANIMFSVQAEPASGKTPNEMLNYLVKLAVKNNRQLSYRLLGHLKEAQRFIGGRMLEGKLVRFCKASADSSNESIALFNIELYVYKEDDRYIILQFKTTAKDSALAECYFKIIADSIH